MSSNVSVGKMSARLNVWQDGFGMAAAHLESEQRRWMSMSVIGHLIPSGSGCSNVICAQEYHFERNLIVSDAKLLNFDLSSM